MTILISIIAALFISVCCGRNIKGHPGIWYAAAMILSLASAGIHAAGIRFGSLPWSTLWEMLSKGYLACALFMIVMWTGALPNGSKAMKKLMPIRGELSIITSVLTFGHIIVYVSSYLKLLITAPSRISAFTGAMLILALVMTLIMIPLFVTSFRRIRRKMDPARWKRLQRWAYAFYALLFVHVLAFSVPDVLRSGGEGLLRVFVYSAVFAGYLACRLLKGRASRTGKRGGLAGRQIAASAAALLLSAALVFGPGIMGSPAAANGPLPADAGIASGSLAEDGQDTPGDETKEEVEDVADMEPVADPEHEEEPQPKSTPGSEPSVHTEPEAEPAPESTPEPVTQSEPEPAPQPEASPQPEPAAPANKYRNGTFTGSAQGFEGGITVSVTIQDDRITGISVISSGDDPDFFGDAAASVIPAILNSQRTDVSAVSGATYSSRGIMDAVRNALANALDQ